MRRRERDGGDLIGREPCLAGVATLGPLAETDDADDEGSNDDVPMPPVPAGMGRLSAAQRSPAELPHVHDVLLKVAAAGSVPPPPPAALAAVPREQRDRWRLDLVIGSDPLTATRIRPQLQPAPASAQSKRTVAELRRAWGKSAAQEEPQEQAAAAKRQRDAEAAAELERHLSQLAGRIPAAWRKVDQFIALSDGHAYDQAVALLADLKMVANRPGGDAAHFADELSKRRATHGRRPTVVGAAREAGLTGSTARDAAAAVRQTAWGTTARRHSSSGDPCRL